MDYITGKRGVDDELICSWTYPLIINEMFSAWIKTQKCVVVKSALYLEE